MLLPQAYLGDTVGSIPDDSSKVIIAIRCVTPIFCFQGHIKVMFYLYGSLLSVQNSMSKKLNVHTLIFKMFRCLKKCLTII